MHCSIYVAALLALPVIQALVQSDGVVCKSPLVKMRPNVNFFVGQTTSIRMEFMECIPLRRQCNKDFGGCKLCRKPWPQGCWLSIRE